MKKPMKSGHPTLSIRRRAEERLKEQRNDSNSETPHSDTDTQKLIHELEVHQIELAMQNEELNLSRAEVEAGLERYADLYDFAPVGYFTLTRDGTISQSNLTGACLLGMERARLVNRRFGLFVSEADRPDFNAFLQRVFASKADEVCEVKLLNEEEGPLWVRIEALVSADRQSCRAAVMDITDRKRAEEALRESEEKMRSIFRAAPTGIGVLVNRVFTEVNQRFCDMTGYTRDELIGQSARMVYQTDADYEYVGREKYDQIAKTGTGAVETRFKRKDGAVIDVWLSSTPMDVADLSRGVTFTVLDITERKLLEKTLQQRVKELAELNALGRTVNTILSTERTLAAALQGMLNAVHPKLAFLFLREGDKLILKKALPPSAIQWLDAVPEHRVGECICGLAVLAKKPLYSLDIFNDGRCTWEECKNAGLKSIAALPLLSEDEVIGVIGLASDAKRDYERQAGFLETLASQVSVALANARLFEIAQLELAERKRVEENLRQVAEKHRELEFIVNQSPAVVFLWKATEGWPVEYVSENIQRFGYTPADFYSGRVPFVSIVHPDDLQRVVAEVTAYSREPGREQFVQEYRIMALSGKVHWLDDRTWDRKNEKGEITHYQGIVVDITERKQAEEAIREQVDELRRWHEVTLGREMRVLDLKREVNELLAQGGQPPRYESAATDGESSSQ